MSESEPRSEAEDPPFSLDLDACARVLAEQQRKREEAARAKRAAEDADEYLRLEQCLAAEKGASE